VPFTFDPFKDEINRVKHGISLSRIEDMDFDRVVSVPATMVKGETRVKLLGVIDDSVWAAVVTYRGENVRVISLRPASRGERRVYAEVG